MIITEKCKFCSNDQKAVQKTSVVCTKCGSFRYIESIIRITDKGLAELNVRSK
jgi:predicted nucleic-acid-binding Zn-ribbon protein